MLYPKSIYNICCFLPVSAFVGYEDCTFPAGTTAYEKRGVATVIPEWNPANCIQCNQCSLVCPHAAIRPCVMTDEEMKKAPESMKAIDMKMPKELAGMHFRMQVSAMDCTGCGNCADVCPAKEKALVMKPFESQLHEAANWDYAQKFLFTASLSDCHWQSFSYKDNLIDKKANVKNSQLSAEPTAYHAQPLFEFSGACAGCGETPYLKCITQLFGEQMMVASRKAANTDFIKSNKVSNATGCSSIYGGSAPATPYCRNYRSGFGSAWACCGPRPCGANSLFEDNAKLSAKPTAHHATSGKKIRKTVAQSESKASSLALPSRSEVGESQSCIDTLKRRKPRPAGGLGFLIAVESRPH